MQQLKLKIESYSNPFDKIIKRPFKFWSPKFDCGLFVEIWFLNWTILS